VSDLVSDLTHAPKVCEDCSVGVNLLQLLSNVFTKHLQNMFVCCIGKFTTMHQPCQLLLESIGHLHCVVHYNGLNLAPRPPRHHGCTRCHLAKFFVTHSLILTRYCRILESNWTWIETWWPQPCTHSRRFSAPKLWNIWIYIPTLSLSTHVTTP
jgi:hypothetical protein